MSSHFSTSIASPSDKSLSIRPVVLLTPDFASDATNPTEAVYIIRANYCSAIAEAGGIPLILPYDGLDITAILAVCDGVVITGSRPGVAVASEREVFEAALIEATMRAHIPIMGICHGMQLLGRTLGGHVVSEVPGDDQTPPRHMPFGVPKVAAHYISIMEESSLAPLAPSPDLEVNSFHLHRLEGPGHFRVVAMAEDGVIEAIEGDTPELSLGVQWHPEYQLRPLDRKIFEMFTARCAERARATKAA